MGWVKLVGIEWVLSPEISVFFRKKTHAIVDMATLLTDI